jgi:hypothetical protein
MSDQSREMNQLILAGFRRGRQTVNAEPGSAQEDNAPAGFDGGQRGRRFFRPATQPQTANDLMRPAIAQSHIERQEALD